MKKLRVILFDDEMEASAIYLVLEARTMMVLFLKSIQKIVRLKQQIAKIYEL